MSPNRHRSIASGVFHASLVLALLCVAWPARSQDAAPGDAATVDRAARVLNLETSPIPDGAELIGPRRLANLSYTTKADVKPAYEFQKRALVRMGWTELPGAYVTAESASGSFAKDGFHASISAFPRDPGKPGVVMVTVNQHGDVDLAKLPVPDGTKPTYVGPVTALFVTEAPRDAAAAACRQLLAARGWQAYGTAGDSLIFKRNAVRLNAMVSAAPAQGGKSVIQYSAELLSADLPAPPDASRVQYADVTKTLSFDLKGTPQSLIDFYRESLGKLGWRPTTDRPVKTGNAESLIFRNPGRQLLTLEFFPIDGFLRGKLVHQSAAEVEEEDRLARKAVERARASARPKRAMPVVTIALPRQARDVQEKDGSLEFTVAAGTAKATVEGLRESLRQAGWKQDVAVLEALAGDVSLSKDGGGSLSILYIDAGVMPAEVCISAIGVTIKKVDQGAE